MVRSGVQADLDALIQRLQGSHGRGLSVTVEEVGPVFVVDKGDVDALLEFAREIGCLLDAWPLIEGDDRLMGARLLGTAEQMTAARSFLYLGLTDLAAHIKPLPDW